MTLLNLSNPPLSPPPSRQVNYDAHPDAYLKKSPSSFRRGLRALSRGRRPPLVPSGSQAKPGLGARPVGEAEEGENEGEEKGQEERGEEEGVDDHSISHVPQCEPGRGGRGR